VKPGGEKRFQQTVLSPGDPDPVLSDDSERITGPPEARKASRIARSGGVRRTSNSRRASQNWRANAPATDFTRELPLPATTTTEQPIS